MKQALAIPTLALLLAVVVFVLHPPRPQWVKSVSWAQRPDGILVDARTKDEFARGHLSGALSWPVENPRMPRELQRAGGPITVHATALSAARALYQARKLAEFRGETVYVVTDPPL